MFNGIAFNRTALTKSLFFFVSTKFNARNINFNQRPLINKIVKIIFLIVHSNSHFHSHSHFHCSADKKVVGKMKNEYGGKSIYMFNRIAFTKILFLCGYQV